MTSSVSKKKLDKRKSKKIHLAISVLNFYCEDMTYNIAQQLNNALSKLDIDATLIFGVNMLSSDTKFIEFKNYILDKFDSQKIKILFKFNEFNLGFGAGNNANFKDINADYFLILNNDIVFENSDWLQALMSKCEDAIGIKNSPHELLENGHGNPNIDSLRFDYIEASCLLIKSSVFNSVGGFDETYINSYFEDSDLSLRLFCKDYKLSWIYVPHIHYRSSSARKVNQHPIQRLSLINQSIFFNRWAWYLSRTEGIKVIIDSDGLGDAINLIYPLLALKNILGNRLVIQTNVIPTIFNIFDFNAPEKYANYFTIDLLKLIEFRSLIPPQNQAYKLLGVNNNSNNNLKNLTKYFPNIKDSKLLLIHIDYQRSNTWQGRAPDLDAFKNIAELFLKKGYAVNIVSQNTMDSEIIKIFSPDCKFISGLSHVELFDLVSQCTFFAGIDSYVFNIAQLFYKRIIVMMGPTSPIARLNQDIDALVLQKKDLNCLGCYHDKEALPLNQCMYFTPRCEKLNYTDSNLEEQLTDFIEKKRHTSAAYSNFVYYYSNLKAQEQLTIKKIFKLTASLILLKLNLLNLLKYFLGHIRNQPLKAFLFGIIISTFFSSLFSYLYFA
jgi:hypothetical protein